jgi:hypothetical protein
MKSTHGNSRPPLTPRRPPESATIISPPDNSSEGELHIVGRSDTSSRVVGTSSRSMPCGCTKMNTVCLKDSQILKKLLIPAPMTTCETFLDILKYRVYPTIWADDIRLWIARDVAERHFIELINWLSPDHICNKSCEITFFANAVDPVTSKMRQLRLLILADEEKVYAVAKSRDRFSYADLKNSFKIDSKTLRLTDLSGINDVPITGFNPEDVA